MTSAIITTYKWETGTNVTLTGKSLVNDNDIDLKVDLCIEPQRGGTPIAYGHRPTLGDVKRFTAISMTLVRELHQHQASSIELLAFVFPAASQLTPAN